MATNLASSPREGSAVAQASLWTHGNHAVQERGQMAV